MLERLLPNEGIQIAANSDVLERDRLEFEELIALAEECVERQISIGKTKSRSVNDLIIEEPFSSTGRIQEAFQCRLTKNLRKIVETVLSILRQPRGINRRRFLNMSNLQCR